MKTAYCPHCGKETKFKKHLTFGSYLGLVMTLGLWVIAIIFSRSRCTECGALEYRNTDRIIYKEPREERSAPFGKSSPPSQGRSKA